MKRLTKLLSRLLFPSGFGVYALQAFVGLVFWAVLLLCTLRGLEFGQVAIFAIVSAIASPFYIRVAKGFISGVLAILDPWGGDLGN